MAHQPHQHLQREIDSLRKQLIQERDSRRFDDALHITTVIKEAEERTLERCIVECMEEANMPTYTEEERIAILTAAERLKEMRMERVKIRKAQDEEIHKQRYEAMRQQIINEQVAKQAAQMNQTLAQGLIMGTSATQVWWDEAVESAQGFNAVQPKARVK